MELIAVVIIIGILAAIAIPRYTTSKERAIGKEAIANLKLIAVAEKIYRMETNGANYYPDSGAETNIANINSNLKLSLTETNWDYSITGGASTFTAYADRQGSGGYLNCQYSINQSQEEPVVASGTCP